MVGGSTALATARRESYSFSYSRLRYSRLSYFRYMVIQAYVYARNRVMDCWSQKLYISLNRVLEFLGIVAVYLFAHIILIVCFSSCLAAVRGVSPLRLLFSETLVDRH